MCRLSSLRNSTAVLLVALAALASACSDETATIVPDAKVSDVGAGDNGKLSDSNLADGVAPCVLPADCSQATEPCKVATCEAGVCGIGLATDGTACDDKNACTADACVPATGLCSFTPIPGCK